MKRGLHMEQRKLNPPPLYDRAAAAVTAIVCLISTADVIRYALLGNGTATLAFLLVNALLVLCALGAWKTRLYPAYALIAGLSAVLFCFTNNPGTTLFNFSFALQALVSGVGATLCTVLLLREKGRLSARGVPFFAALALLMVGWAAVWGAQTAADKGKTRAEHAVWAVPQSYDSAECAQPGALEKLDYETKAYATDGRTVLKSAWVYLPWGYDEARQYNILYLLHGTGDDEQYWLRTFSYNKTMVDHLIANGDIEPLIIVTPTFYVENDCADDLDRLTYSFKEELRNDLMPAVESRYATYAASCDDRGFAASREHRAFAGLSRGAVTTLHSVFCGCLDYFASFGTFSASRTPVEQFISANQTDATRGLPIRYWYVASGTFDFGLVSQIQDRAAILKADPRLIEGDNTSFDIYPMRYHSMGNWHLALYNFLQKLF